jgi:hypothetical protein
MNRQRIYLLLLVVGLLAGAPWAFTQAVFTDAQAVTGNTFSTGTVDIATSPTSALVTFSNMAPGDKVTAPITVTNAGTLQLRYAITTSIAGSTTLSDGLTLRIKSGVSSCTDAGFGVGGTSLYAGTLTAGAVGDPTPGAQVGDRTLDPSASEVLCFQVELPTSAANTLQSRTTTATFTFQAEQTANNP